MNVYQRLDIVARRHVILRKLVLYWEAWFKFLYKDETWCNFNHTRRYNWMIEGNEKKKDFSNIQSGKCALWMRRKVNNQPYWITRRIIGWVTVENAL